MCSICGGHYPSEYIKKASDTMTHRGPDAQGLFSDHTIALAHNRLSIIDLSDHAKQPFTSTYCPDLVLVFNGEIYNHLEIKKKLSKAHVPFYTQSDTEVLLHAFAYDGEKCLEYLNGDFAFAIYNKQTKELFLARDRLGNKPLFYHINDQGKIFFSSEIKAFFAIDHFSFDMEEVSSWILFGSSHSSKSIYHHITPFPPAHFAYFKEGDQSLKYQSYWSFTPRSTQKSLKDALEELDFLLQDAIALRAYAHVPIALSVSGGIDSSLIAHYIKKMDLDCRFFGVIFEDFKESDESIHIKQLAQDLGADITFITPQLHSIKDHFTQLLDAQDEIFRSFSVYAQFLLFKNISPYCKVVLGGQGADELFGGYYHHVGRYLFSSQEAFKDRILLYGHEAIKEYTFGLKCSLEDHLKIHLFKEDNAKNIQKLEALHLPVPCFDFLMERFLLDFTQSLWLDTTFFNLPHLLRYEDRNAMYFGVENRTPFTDYRIVEFAFSIDPSLKCAKGFSKYILRELLDRLGSPSLAWRTDKMGFCAPEEALMQTLGYHHASLFDVRMAIFEKMKELR